MPVKIIGMIGVAPPSSKASLHVIEGGLSPSYLSEFGRAHDRAGFDMVLVGYSSSSAEGFLVSLYAAMQTDRIGYLIAHRPGFNDPIPTRFLALPRPQRERRSSHPRCRQIPRDRRSGH